MARFVLLRHTLADDTSHLDWMIEDTTLAGERRLRTWRLESRPDGAGSFAGERIGDHRVFYLDHEGDVTRGRGSVRRVGSGLVTHARFGADACEVTLAWDGGSKLRYEGRIEADGASPARWVFGATPA